MADCIGNIRISNEARKFGWGKITQLLLQELSCFLCFLLLEMPSCPTFCPLPLCQVFHFLSLLLQKRNVAENIHLLYIHPLRCVSKMSSLTPTQRWWPTWFSFQASFMSLGKKNVHSLSKSLHAQFKTFHLGCFFGMQERNLSAVCHSFEGQLRVESTYIGPILGYSGVPYSIRDGAVLPVFSIRAEISQESVLLCRLWRLLVIGAVHLRKIIHTSLVWRRCE